MHIALCNRHYNTRTAQQHYLHPPPLNSTGEEKKTNQPQSWQLETTCNKQFLHHEIHGKCARQHQVPTTVKLVRSVHAVVTPVTPETAVNAVSITALPLMVWTRLGSWCRRHWWKPSTERCCWQGVLVSPDSRMIKVKVKFISQPMKWWWQVGCPLSNSHMEVARTQLYAMRAYIMCVHTLYMYMYTHHSQIHPSHLCSHTSCRIFHSDQCTGHFHIATGPDCSLRKHRRRLIPATANRPTTRRIWTLEGGYSGALSWYLWPRNFSPLSFKFPIDIKFCSVAMHQKCKLPT